MSPLRKQILDLARTFDGRIMTVQQANGLLSILGSMDDTLTDDEVLMFLKLYASGDGPNVPSRHKAPASHQMVKVSVDEKGKPTKPAPFSRS